MTVKDEFDAFKAVITEANNHHPELWDFRALANEYVTRFGDALKKDNREHIPKSIFVTPTTNDEIVDILKKELELLKQHQKDDPDTETQYIVDVLERILDGKT